MAKLKTVETHEPAPEWDVKPEPVETPEALAALIADCESWLRSHGSRNAGMALRARITGIRRRRPFSPHDEALATLQDSLGARLAGRRA